MILNSRMKWMLGVCVIVLIAGGSWILLSRSNRGNFKCPENYSDQQKEEYLNDMAQWIGARKKSSPDISIDDLLRERRDLLQKHGCRANDDAETEQAPQSIESIFEDAKNEPAVSFNPNDKIVTLLGEAFGPYQVKNDKESGAAIAYFAGASTGWFVLDLYTPEALGVKSWSTKDLAGKIRDTFGSSVVYSFEAPEADASRSAYFLVMTSPAKDGTQVNFMKIGTLGTISYSVTYGRIITDAVDANDAALRWAGTSGVPYFLALSKMVPTASWISKFTAR